MKFMLVLLLIITLILLFIVFILIKYNVKKKEYLHNSYRLGDFILVRPSSRKKFKIDINKILKKFPNSIASLYFKKIKEHNNNNNKIDNNIDILIQVLKENNLINLNNKMTMHIRLGDVVCSSHHTDKKPLSINKLINIISNFKNEFINIYTFYHNGCEEKSKEYINKLKKFKNVKIYLNREPDMDFIDMINSKIHISGTGNFSKVINLIRDKLNLETILLNNYI